MTGPRRPDPRGPQRRPRPQPPGDQQQTTPTRPWYLAPRPTGSRPPQPGPPVPPPPADDRPDRRHSNHRLLIATGLAVLGLLGLLAAALALGVPKLGGARQLDVDAAQVGVKQVLTDPINGYGSDNVTDVRCNNGRNPTVRKGSGFSCEVNVDGTKRQVRVVFSDDAGTYEVDRPR